MIIYRLYSVINIKMFLRAIDGARTRGLDLGKVARYQLRHYRIYFVHYCVVRTKYNILWSYRIVNFFFKFFSKNFTTVLQSC